MIRLEECSRKNIKVKLDDQTELIAYVKDFCIGEDFDFEYDSLLIEIKIIIKISNSERQLRVGDLTEVFEDEIVNIEILD